MLHTHIYIQVERYVCRTASCALFIFSEHLLCISFLWSPSSSFPVSLILISPLLSFEKADISLSPSKSSFWIPECLDSHVLISCCPYRFWRSYYYSDSYLVFYIFVKIYVTLLLSSWIHLQRLSRLCLHAFLLLHTLLIKWLWISLLCYYQIISAQHQGSVSCLELRLLGAAFP